MAKRGGKAANRKAKQRRAQRPSTPPRPVAPIEPTLSEEMFDAEPMRTAAVAAPAARESVREPVRKPSRDPRAMIAGPSRLGERAQAEYHYVIRDLRNIGVLVVVMAAILAVAFIVFNVFGIARAA